MGRKGTDVLEKAGPGRHGIMLADPDFAISAKFHDLRYGKRFTKTYAFGCANGRQQKAYHMLLLHQCLVLALSEPRPPRGGARDSL